MYDDFEKWVNNILENDIPEGVVAVAFNIYDDGDGNWSVEAVGTSSFDEEDDDWACDEITDFGSREKNFAWNENYEWEDAFETIVKMLNKYLEEGCYKDKLKALNGVGAGFVDGDLEVIYTKE